MPRRQTAYHRRRPDLRPRHSALCSENELEKIQGRRILDELPKHQTIEGIAKGIKRRPASEQRRAFLLFYVIELCFLQPEAYRLDGFAKLRLSSGAYHNRPFRRQIHTGARHAFHLLQRLLRIGAAMVAVHALDYICASLGVLFCVAAVIVIASA